MAALDRIRLTGLLPKSPAPAGLFHARGVRRRRATAVRPATGVDGSRSGARASALAFAVEHAHQSWSALDLEDELGAGPAVAAAGPAVFAAVVAVTPDRVR